MTQEEQNLNKDNDSTLIINLNEEYKIKIEAGREFDHSIFKNVYNTALKCVEEIVEQSDKNIDSQYDDFNNIVAFTGERGKGKSSSMISFRDALVNKEKTEHESFFKIHSIISKKEFATIEIIDPSLFRGGESLFEIILAQMFQKFQEKIKKNDSNLTDEKRRTIIKQFQEVFENLQIITSDRKDLYKKESIEALSRLATSSNLRRCFNQLVENYLKEFENNKHFLLIAVDDFDLNISDAHRMLEDIRQFLIQSNIILLIACKVEQLKEVVTLHFKQQKVDSDLENKAKRYIDKLLPFERRLILPDVRNQVQENFEIIEADRLLFKTVNNSFKVNILKLLYDKVGLFQPLNLLKQNPIIPDTIRQTQNFISVVFSLNNDENLKNYLLDEIINDTVLYTHISELENSSDDTFLLLLNKKLIKILANNSNVKHDNIFRDVPNKTLRILNAANIPDRIGIGDIVFLLREYENSIAIDQYSDLKFIGYLKLYISLKLKSLLKSTDQKFLKYGFTNYFTELLPKDNRISRDHVLFNKSSISTQLSSLNEKDTLIFAMWSQYLGSGYNDYRSISNKDIFVELYDNGHISPLALLHNIYNIKELSQHYKINTEIDLFKELVKWRESSSFLNQLCNPSFVLKIIEYVKEFRAREVKEALPDNYYDIVCLLFNYGILYALDRIQNEYKIDGLASDYLKNPIFIEMLQRLTNKDLSFRAVNDLNRKYSINKQEISDQDSSESIADLMNTIYENNKEGGASPENPKQIQLSPEATSILRDLRWQLENKKITSRLIGNRLNNLIKVETLDQSIIDEINNSKYGLNGESSYEQAKEHLIGVINNLLKNE